MIFSDLSHRAPIKGTWYRPAPVQETPRAKPQGRAGRNLKAAIGLGVGLGAGVVGLLLLPPLFFVAFIALVCLYAEWEMARALARANVVVCLPVLWVGSLGMIACAYVLGIEACGAAMLLTLLASAVWRLLQRDRTGALADVVATSFTCAYLPFLACFPAMMLNFPGRPFAIVFWVLCTISNDIGGYAAGVFFGKHPMAPSVSPAKSWEGFAGSVLMCALAAAACLAWVGVNPLWALLVGPLSAMFATLGDLGESLLKRSLKLKDMGTILPGHGGVMDRLDSLLVTAPLFFLICFLALGV